MFNGFEDFSRAFFWLFVSKIVWFGLFYLCDCPFYSGSLVLLFTNLAANCFYYSRRLPPIAVDS